LIASALLADLFALVLGAISLPEADRNPASPEFGALQWQWAVVLVLAMFLMGGAMLAGSGRTRRWLAALLLLTLFFSIEPATHLYKYRIKPRLGAHHGRHERMPVGAIAGPADWQDAATSVWVCLNA
jgi:hypothetical protein